MMAAKKDGKRKPSMPAPAIQNKVSKKAPLVEAPKFNMKGRFYLGIVDVLLGKPIYHEITDYKTRIGLSRDCDWRLPLAEMQLLSLSPLLPDVALQRPLMEVRFERETSSWVAEMMLRNAFRHKPQPYLTLHEQRIKKDLFMGFAVSLEHRQCFRVYLPETWGFFTMLFIDTEKLSTDTGASKGSQETSAVMPDLLTLNVNALRAVSSHLSPLDCVRKLPLISKTFDTSRLHDALLGRELHCSSARHRLDRLRIGEFTADEEEVRGDSRDANGE